jgi:hypothetical protein
VRSHGWLKNKATIEPLASSIVTRSVERRP